jgi:hypothetical protein
VAPPAGRATAGAGVRRYEPLDRRTIGTGVFSTGGGVCTALGGGACGALGGSSACVTLAGSACVALVATGVPAGGVVLTPIFILKLCLPRYTTPSSPPSTCCGTATTRSFPSSNVSVLALDVRH